MPENTEISDAKIYHEYLFEQSKKPEGKKVVVMLRDNEVWMRLAVAWTAVSREIDKDDGGWGGCTFSYTEWCELAGLPCVNSNKVICMSLQNLHIVLPDGRLNHWIGKFLDRLGQEEVTRPSILFKGKKTR